MGFDACRSAELHNINLLLPTGCFSVAFKTAYINYTSENWYNEHKN